MAMKHNRQYLLKGYDWEKLIYHLDDAVTFQLRKQNAGEFCDLEEVYVCGLFCHNCRVNVQAYHLIDGPFDEWNCPECGHVINCDHCGRRIDLQLECVDLCNIEYAMPGGDH